jgi:hypothetical protein
MPSIHEAAPATAARAETRSRVGCKNSIVTLRRVHIRESDRRGDPAGPDGERGASRPLRSVSGSSCSLARSRRPRSTTNSSRRRTTTYKADTSKGDLSRRGPSTLAPAHQPWPTHLIGYLHPTRRRHSAATAGLRSPPHIRDLRIPCRCFNLRSIPLHGCQPDDDRSPLRPPRSRRTRARNHPARRPQPRSRVATAGLHKGSIVGYLVGPLLLRSVW